MFRVRRRLLSLFLLIACAVPVAAEDTETTKEDAARALLEATPLLAKKRYKEAMPLLEVALSCKDVDHRVYLLAAECAFRTTDYRRAGALCKTGLKLVRAVRPVTPKSKELRKQFEKFQKDAKRQLAIRDVHTRVIVRDMVKYLDNDDMIEKSRYLTETSYDKDGAKRTLRPAYTGPHLAVLWSKVPPHWNSFLIVTEAYPDEKMARARYKAVVKLIEKQRRQWEPLLRKRLQADGAKFKMLVRDDLPTHIDGDRVFERVQFEWRIRGGPELTTDQMGYAQLGREIVGDSDEPAEDSWWVITLYVDARWFGVWK